MYLSANVILTSMPVVQTNEPLSVCNFKYLMNGLFFIVLLFKTQKLNRFRSSPIKPIGVEINKANESKAQVDPICK